MSDELHSVSLSKALLGLHRVSGEASPSSPTVGRMWAGSSTDPDPSLSPNRLVVVILPF